MLIVWTMVACLVQCVNTIRWNRNVENWTPVWCDFCTSRRHVLAIARAKLDLGGYFLVASDVGLAASGVSINRRLYMIVTLDPRRHEVSLQLLLTIRPLTCRLEVLRF